MPGLEIKILELNSCLLLDDGFSLLLDILKNYQFLEELSINSNEITELSVSNIDRFFKVNNKLKAMSLLKNKIYKSDLLFLEEKSLNKCLLDEGPEPEIEVVKENKKKVEKDDSDEERIN